MSNECACAASATKNRAFDVAYNDTGLTTGETLYTPDVGEILIDAWVQVTTPFNGTTPKLDIGTFLAGNAGWFSHGKGVIDLTVADAPGVLVDASPISGQIGSRLSVSVAGDDPDDLARALPAKFTTVDPVKVVVTQTGAKGGTATGATAGAAVVYLQTAAPCRCDDAV